MPIPAISPPIGTVYGVTLNDRKLLAQRMAEFGAPPYQKPPEKPVLFIKTPNTLNWQGGQVALPHGERLQPGPALGVVIGRDASRVTAANALDYVAGYVIANEFSLPEDSYYRPAVKAKCRDGFCALGYMIPVAEVPKPGQLGIRLYVNGELRQSGSTEDWVRPLGQLLEEITEFMTLYAGDVLLTGTPAGRVDVQVGDDVTVKIDGLGELTNIIVPPEGGK